MLGAGRDPYLAVHRIVSANGDGISANTLSARLKTMEEAGVIERRFYEERPQCAEYLLTAKGRELGPELKGLRAWGQKHTR